MVQIATPDIEHVHHLVDLGEMMQSETIFSDRPYIRENVARFALMCITDPYNWFIKIGLSDDGAPAGFFVGKIVADVINNDINGEEAYFYVKPEYRGTRLAIMLMRSFEKWLIDQGDIIDVRLGTTSGVNADKTGAFYEKMGYNRVGGVYIKELERG